jgi:hypothetical protein
VSPPRLHPLRALPHALQAVSDPPVRSGLSNGPSPLSRYLCPLSPSLEASHSMVVTVPMPGSKLLFLWETQTALFNVRLFRRPGVSRIALLLVGIGQCSTPCSANPLESCGSAPQTLPARRGSIVARQTEDPTIFATVYGPQDVVPATVAAPVPGTAADVTGWSDAGCYNSELYLLDSLLTGFSYSVAADPTATLDGSTCITTCANQDASNLYAITLGTTCYCTATPPPADSLAADQSSCNLACQGDPTERCGGKGAVGTTNVFGTVYSKIAPVCPIFPILCSMLNAQCSMICDAT